MKINRLIPLFQEPVGFTSSGTPVHPVFGGAADLEVEPDTDEEVEEETDDDPADEPEDEPKGKKGKYAPPEESEWLKTRTALAKANASAKERRLALAEAQKRIDDLERKEAEREAKAERDALLAQQRAAVEAASPGTGKRNRKGAAGGGVPAPTDLPEGVLTRAQVRQREQQAAKEAEERTAEKYRSMAVGSAIRSALISEGLSKEAAGRAARLLDATEIEIGEDGEVTGGLEEQLAVLKEELPQLFKKEEPEPPKPRRKPAPRVTASPQPEAEQRPLSSAERMAQAVLGSRV